MSKTTIIVPTGMVDGKPMGEVKSQVSSGNTPTDYAPLGYHSIMAMLAGLFVFVGLMGIFGLLMWWNEGARNLWAHFLVFSLAAGLVVSAYFGFNWIQEGATRAWRISDGERFRRWKMEDNAMAATSTDEEEEEEAKSEGWKLELGGYKILIMHYVEGLQCTRPECEEKGIEQGVWNACNKVMIALRIKGERKWMDEVALDEAMRRWKEEAWFTDDGRVRVRSSAGIWNQVV